ncbi:MAG: long-chain fatty acid--CoA ligase [Candidatus Omnitrophica bacterium]|nr:long-chain fatty acid--CoA ligase [Candidatus Omnitrophota bacterium]
MSGVPANLALLFEETVRQFPDKQAFLFKQSGRYEALTWSQAAGKVRAVASALLRLGVKSGDRLAILSENRPEWAIFDLAVLSIGAATVPIYTSLTSSEIQYILSDAGVHAIAVSNKSLLEKIVPIHRSLPALRRVVIFEAAAAVSGGELAIPVSLMTEWEKENPDPGLPRARGAVEADAIASVIYTYGTTGEPKGVLLTHDNFIQNLLMCRTALRMGPSDVHLSFLPLSHVFERLAGYYLMVHIGATIGYAENMDTVSGDLARVRPTFILGVPRFFEKIRARVLEAVEKAGPVRKALFFWARDLKKKKGPFFKLKHAIATALVYKKFKGRLGGRVRFCVSGGAPLAKEIAEFFYDLDVLIYEGYGLTETSPVISANREDRFKFGTVGIPLEGVRVRIAEDGEILTEGPCVMKGYLNKLQETADVLKDGWFHTGDLGLIDPDGFLTITGRKKDLIVTSGGKKVAPRPIEELLESDPFIRRCVLFGEGRRFITALIVPDPERVREYAQTQKIAFKTYQDLLKDEKIYSFLEQRLENLSAHLANFEKIKYFALLEFDFSQDSGELTPTLKVKRDAVLSRHKDLLLPFYERENP